MLKLVYQEFSSIKRRFLLEARHLEVATQVNNQPLELQPLLSLVIGQKFLVVLLHGPGSRLRPLHLRMCFLQLGRVFFHFA